jgi:hypothetical protein
MGPAMLSSGGCGAVAAELRPNVNLHRRCARAATRVRSLVSGARQRALSGVRADPLVPVEAAGDPDELLLERLAELAALIDPLPPITEAGARALFLRERPATPSTGLRMARRARCRPRPAGCAAIQVDRGL